MSEFHIDETIQSQYSASKHITNLVSAFGNQLTPKLTLN